MAASHKLDNLNLLLLFELKSREESSFANTEGGEYLIEQFFVVHPADQLLHSPHCAFQVVAAQVCKRFVQKTLQV
jgi:hypothetical protein